MSYEIQFAKITCLGKLADRFLTCQHFKSEDLTKSSMGEIFSLIEILSPWYNSAQIGQMIIGNFSNHYYQGGSTSDLVNFEAALKKVNENLAHITQNGETEWIGNLSGILATIVGTSLFLSPAGRVEAYLFRDGKINHLTYGLNSKVEVHPLKTFSNVISGELRSRDKILITNKNLFDCLPLESVRQIIALNDSSEAASQITRLLRKSKIKNVNLIITNIASQNEIAAEPLKGNAESVYYLDKSTESPLGKIKSFWQAILAPLTKIATSKSLGFIKKGSKASTDKLKTLTSKISEKRKTNLSKPKEEAKEDAFEREFISKDSRDDLLKDEEIKYSPEFYVHYYKEKKLRKENRFKNIFGFFGLIWRKISSFAKWFFELYKNKDKRKYFYIIIAAILISIVALTIGFRSNNKNSVGNLEAQKILDEAIAAQKDGRNLLTSGDTEKAKEKFIFSIEKSQKISSSPLVAKDAEALIATSYQELDKLTSTTRFSELSPLVSVADTAKGFFIVSGEAFVLTENDVYKSNLLSGKSQKIDSLPTNKGSFVGGTNLNGTLYLYTSNQNLFSLAPSSEKLNQVEISADGRWETANALSSYVGSIYLLDGVLGQIYKHSSSKEVFEKGEDYISNNKELKQTVSIAIDGSIYVLKNDGQAIKYLRARLQDFSLKNIPTPFSKISEPRKIYTNSDTPSLYILDSGQKRILEFDKDGFFVRQYALPDIFTKISDFNVSVKSKKMWFLNNKDLYEISI